MSAVLPDVSVTDIAPTFGPLEWVGMQGIDLPVTIDEPGYHRELHAKADVQVDLPAPQVKGIHMSRLYQLLESWGQESHISPMHVHTLLSNMVDSHHECDSRRARLRLDFDLLIRRPALVTAGLSGWKSYPVQLNASLVDAEFALSVECTVGYSSTCPCSAALSRQLIEDSFLQSFSNQPLVDPATVASWLRVNASLATPHSQRSEAHVCVSVERTSPSLGLLSLIEAVETTLGTPVQTAVKRADEQAFAALNGQNLMFVEDAARRIRVALSGHQNPKVHVRHLESLHPHDAAAWSAPFEQGSHHER